MIKAVVFDHGGVLADDIREKIVKHCADALGVQPKKLQRVLDNYINYFSLGKITEYKMWEHICEDLNIRGIGVRSLWLEGFHNFFSRNEKMKILLFRLKKRGDKVGLLSNAEMPIVQLYLKEDYGETFDALVFSCIEHVMKPDKKIFDAMRAKIGFKASELVLIDDNKEHAEAAIKYGWNAIHYKNPHQTMDELRRLGVKFGN